MFIKRADVVSGIWKFNDSVGIDTILALAAEMKRSDPERYLQIYIRGCAEDQTGICFQYQLPDSEQKTHRRFFHSVKGRLEKRFKSQFVGYSTSRPTWLLS